MATQYATKKESEESKARALRIIEAYTAENPEGRIYTQTEYVGKAGTAYVRVFVTFVGSDGLAKLSNLTHAVAEVAGLKLKNRDGRSAIVTSGGGYSRAQYVLDSLSWSVMGQANGYRYEEI